VTEIPAQFDEEAGVGDINGKPFMWMIDDGTITATFDSGETLQFPHGYDGWLELIFYGLVLTRGM
jgi:hypothetical protein